MKWDLKNWLSSIFLGVKQRLRSWESGWKNVDLVCINIQVSWTATKASFLFGDFSWGNFYFVFMNTLSASLCNQTTVFSQNSYNLSVTLSIVTTRWFWCWKQFHKEAICDRKEKKITAQSNWVYSRSKYSLEFLYLLLSIEE